MPQDKNPEHHSKDQPRLKGNFASEAQVLAALSEEMGKLNLSIQGLSRSFETQLNKLPGELSKQMGDVFEKKVADLKPAESEASIKQEAIKNIERVVIQNAVIENAVFSTPNPTANEANEAIEKETHDTIGQNAPPTPPPIDIDTGDSKPEPEDKKPEKGFLSAVTGLTREIIKINAALFVVNKLLKGSIVGLASLPGKIAGAFGSLVKAISGLDLSLKGMTKAFSEGLETADKLQIRALGFGRDLEGMSNAFGGQLAKLPGTMSQNLETTFDSFEAGLRGNTLRVTQLATVTKIAGRNSKQLLANFESFQTSMAMTNAELDNLAVSVGLAQLESGVTIEKLTKAITALTQETKNVAVFKDLGDEFGGAIAEVVGMMGGRGEKEIAQIMRVLTGGTQQFVEATRLGIDGQRRMLRSGMTTQEVVDVILSTIETGSTSMDRWVSVIEGMGEAGLEQEAIHRLLGDGGTALLTAQNLLQVEETALAKDMEKMANVLASLKQQALELWDPIRSMWLKQGSRLFQQLLDNALEIQTAFTDLIVTPLETIFDEFYSALTENKDILFTITSIFTTLGRVISAIARSLSEAITGEESIIENLIGSVGQIMRNIADGFDSFLLETLPRIESAFLSMAVMIMHAMDFFMGPGTDYDEDLMRGIENRITLLSLSQMTDVEVEALAPEVERMPTGMPQDVLDSIDDFYQDFPGMAPEAYSAEQRAQDFQVIRDMSRQMLEDAGYDDPSTHPAQRAALENILRQNLLIPEGIPLLYDASSLDLTPRAIQPGDPRYRAPIITDPNALSGIAPSIEIPVEQSVPGWAQSLQGMIDSRRDIPITRNFDEYVVRNPVSGDERTFVVAQDAHQYAVLLQDQLREAIVERRERGSFQNQLLEWEAQAAAFAAETAAEHNDWFSELEARLAETERDRNARNNEELEIIPGTSFGSAMGDILSESIYELLQGQQTTHAEFIRVQEDTINELRGINTSTTETVDVLNDTGQITARGGG